MKFNEASELIFSSSTFALGSDTGVARPSSTVDKLGEMACFSKPVMGSPASSRSDGARRRRMRRMGLATLATSAVLLPDMANPFVIGSAARATPKASLNTNLNSPPVWDGQEPSSSKTTMRTTAAAAMSALACQLSWIFPKRKARKSVKAVTGTAGAPAGPMSSSFTSNLSSSGSAFLGSTLAGSVTVTAPAPSASSMTSMKMLFERFNEHALRSVMSSQQQCRRLGQSQLGTEILLIGIMKQGKGVVDTVVKKAGIDIEAASQRVAERLGQGDGEVPKDIPFSPECKQILQTAVEESKKLRASAVDPSHIFTALLASPNECPAEEILKMDPQELIKEMKAELQKMEEDAEVPVGADGVPKKATKALEEFGKNLTQARICMSWICANESANRLRSH